MPSERGIVNRPRPWWPSIVAMLVAFGVVWLSGWGLSAACLVAAAANVIVALLTPRQFGRWTE